MPKIKSKAHNKRLVISLFILPAHEQGEASNDVVPHLCCARSSALFDMQKVHVGTYGGAHSNDVARLPAAADGLVVGVLFACTCILSTDRSH